MSSAKVLKWKKNTIEGIIFDCIKEGQLSKPTVSMRGLHIKGIGSERKKFDDTMELIDYVMSKECWSCLNSCATDEDLYKFATVILGKAMTHLLRLEGKTKKGKETATFTAIGAQISKLRAKGLVGFGASNGTPVGNKSMRSFVNI